MKKYTLMIMAFAVVALLGVGTVSALGMGLGLSEEDREFAKTNHDAIRNAVETGNYAEWEGLMQERLAVMEDRINEETFNSLVERHDSREEFRAAAQELKDSGEFSREAMEGLREEYGVEGKGPKGEGQRGEGLGKGSGKGSRMGSRMGNAHGDCPLA